jgi:hypothetical protein
MYGRVVISLMERHAAELEALRLLHAGELITPSDVNEMYGHQADLDRLSRLIDRSSASPKEKSTMKVSFLFEALSRVQQ